ncbi:MAG: hypothetical protein RPU52_09500 [Candidatus Sedimenticola sp. (ex Thyasira tokunagai)]
MDIRTTPTPGQYGTKQLLKEYSDQLVCVLYRYDKKRNRGYKTVELIVDEREEEKGTAPLFSKYCCEMKSSQIEIKKL